ncbi:MFS transporter [Metallosphaera tengchongensis]|uniref:MFS transporter n=1 Tax=Metallosphaera tengchongensis TaxID=1532350 RepID=A0A6N0P1A7_9CREN|nr:MFS transporter [Metallosphaera tengchongensis]QKR01040.1 MFS transporter [Metallosphaera tengchongensis]
MTIAARATNNMVTTTVGPLSKYGFNFSNTLVGLVTAVMFATTFVTTSYINPSLSSQLRRKAFVASNLVIVVLLLWLYFSNPFTIWIIAALIGFAFGLVMPNLITAASLTNDRRTAERLLSLYSTSLSVSLILGPSYESFLLGRLGYREVFLAFIPLAIIALTLSWTVKFPDVKKEIRGMKALRNRGFLSSVLSITTYNVPFAAITAFLTILAIDKFHVPGDLAYSTYVPFFTTSFLTRLYMTVRPFNSLRLPMLVSVIITVLGLWGTVFSPTYGFFLIVMAFLGIPHGSVFPMSTIMIQRATGKEERNAVNSYFLAFNNFLFIAVPAIVGYMSEYLGLDITFGLLAIPVLVVAVVFFKQFWNDRILKGFQGQ